LKEVIGENSGILTERYKITWISSTRKSVDTAALKKDNIYNNYLKQSETRYLRVNLRKEGK
jgi:hypothetical protein